MHRADYDIHLFQQVVRVVKLAAWENVHFGASKDADAFRLSGDCSYLLKPLFHLINCKPVCNPLAPAVIGYCNVFIIELPCSRNHVTNHFSAVAPDSVAVEIAFYTAISDRFGSLSFTAASISPLFSRISG